MAIPSTYRLHADIQAVLSRIGESGELSEELTTAFNNLNLDIDNAVNELFRVIRTANMSATALRNEVSYLSTHARHWDVVKETARQRLKELLEELGVKLYQTELCRPVIVLNPPKVKLAENFDLQSLKGTEWEDLLDVEVSLSSDKVKKLAASGKQLPPGVQVVQVDTHVRV